MYTKRPLTHGWIWILGMILEICRSRSGGNSIFEVFRPSKPDISVNKIANRNCDLIYQRSSQDKPSFLNPEQSFISSLQSDISSAIHGLPKNLRIFDDFADIW